MRRPRIHLRGALVLGLVTALSLAGTPAADAASALTAPRAHALDLRALDAVDAATAAARGWQDDVALVHVEAADSLAGDGSAAAWAFVFWSPSARLARAYTVRHDGTARADDLAFPFDPPALEGAWADPTDALDRLRKDPKDPGLPPGARLVGAVLSRGLTQSAFATRDALPRTTWLLAFAAGDGAPSGELLLDAVRGVVIERRAATPAEAADSPAGAIAGGRKGLPPWLAAHATLALTRLGALRDLGATASRARWLTGRESASLARLSAQDAALDSLGQGGLAAAGGNVDQRLAALAQWRAGDAAVDSALARSAARIDACLKDLGSETPTAVAVYLSVTGHAHPARVSVLVDGVEATRVSYGDAEWRALDAGAWAELARVSVRPGARTIQVEIEGADRKLARATWQASVAPGQWSLLHLALAGPGAGGPTLDLLSAATP